MSLIFKHAWLMFIAVTCLNALIWWWRTKTIADQNPLRAAEIRAFLKGWLFFGNLPWLVMGAGILFGGIPDLFFYFFLRSGDPWVIAFLLTVITLWISGAYWIYFRNGAEVFGTLANRPMSPGQVKIFYGLLVLGGVVAVVVMFSLREPPSTFGP